MIRILKILFASSTYKSLVIPKSGWKTYGNGGFPILTCPFCDYPSFDRVCVLHYLMTEHGAREETKLRVMIRLS